MVSQILRLPAVIQKTQLSRSSIYKLEAEGKFPQRVKLFKGSKNVGWYADEVEKFLANRPRANSENSIKAVTPALAARKIKSHE